jgi:hypothetical protein
MMQPGEMQARLRQMPDASLRQMLQGSTSVPEFYVMAELSRRQRMRGAEAGGPTAPEPVRQDMAAPVGFYQGGNPLREIGKDDPEYNPAMDPEMRAVPGRGGPRYEAIVRGSSSTRGGPRPDSASRSWSFRDLFSQPDPVAHDVGPTYVPPAPATPPVRDAGADLDAASRVAMEQQFGGMYPGISAPRVDLKAPDLVAPGTFTYKDRTAQRQAEITADREALADQKRSDFNNTLMSAGVAMMGGSSPYFMSNLAEGAKAGLDVYSRTTADRRKREQDLKQQERGLDSEAEQRAYLNMQEANKGIAAVNVNRTNQAGVDNKEQLVNANMDLQVSQFNAQQEAAKNRMMYQLSARTGKAELPVAYKKMMDSLASNYATQWAELSRAMAESPSPEAKQRYADQLNALEAAYLQQGERMNANFRMPSTTAPAPMGSLSPNAYEGQ